MGVGAAGGHLWLGSLYERTFRAVLRGGARGALRWPRVPAPQSPFWAPLSGLPFRASPEKPPPPFKTSKTRTCLGSFSPIIRQK